MNNGLRKGHNERDEKGRKAREKGVKCRCVLTMDPAMLALSFFPFPFFTSFIQFTTLDHSLTLASFNALKKGISIVARLFRVCPNANTNKHATTSCLLPFPPFRLKKQEKKGAYFRASSKPLVAPLTFLSLSSFCFHPFQGARSKKKMRRRKEGKVREEW